MKQIAISDKAYKRLLEIRAELEKKQHTVISIGRALDYELFTRDEK